MPLHHLWPCCIRNADSGAELCVAQASPWCGDGVAVDDHGHIAVPLFASRSHRASAPRTGDCGAAQRSEPTKCPPGQRTACQCTLWRLAAALNVIAVVVSDDPTRQTRCQRAIEGRVVLQEPADAVAAAPSPEPLPVATSCAAPTPPSPGPSWRDPSCTRWHLNPLCAQRSLKYVDSGHTTSAARCSPRPPLGTRVCANCSRTAIASFSHRGPLRSLISQSRSPAGPRPLLEGPATSWVCRHRREGSSSSGSCGSPSRRSLQVNPNPSTAAPVAVSEATLSETIDGLPHFTGCVLRAWVHRLPDPTRRLYSSKRAAGFSRR